MCTREEHDFLGPRLYNVKIESNAVESYFLQFAVILQSLLAIDFLHVRDGTMRHFGQRFELNSIVVIVSYAIMIRFSLFPVFM